MASDAAALEYGRRLDQRRQEAQRWSRIERSVSLSRLAVMVVLVVVAWLSIQSRLLSPWWTALPLLAFLVLVVAHRRILDRGALATRSAN